MNWWNDLDEIERRRWMKAGGDTGRVADAWEAYGRCQQKARPAPLISSSLLSQYGVSVEGPPEGLVHMADLLADFPVGRAMLLIAERGREYGVRLFATERFDELIFLENAACFGLDREQARLFVLNLSKPAERD